jgi:hypothetical protein
VTPLAQALIEAAAQALAAGRRAPTSERTLRACHGDAQAVVVAVLASRKSDLNQPACIAPSMVSLATAFW